MYLSWVDVRQAGASPNPKNKIKIDLKMNVIVMYEACCALLANFVHTALSWMNGMGPLLEQ